MKLLFFLGLLFGGMGSSVLAAESPVPKVVVSIKPLHSLVAGVMAGVGEPLLLVKGGGSPHGYVLRPSEARALAKAQLVVWVGHELESFLEKPLATIARNARQVNLSEQLQEHLLSKRAGDGWEKHDHHHRGAKKPSEHGHQHHHHKKSDLHLWLDPILAQQIVLLTRNALIDIDPVNRDQYQANAAAVIERLAQLDRHLKTQLDPVKDVPYIVFHAAYQYFELAYGLNAVGSITIDPARGTGARRIFEIRSKIKESGVRCVFTEPQFEPRLVATVVAGTEAKTGILDPLGADLPAGPDAYFQLMINLGDNLYKGLK